MVGFFIPGETAVVIGGVLAGLGKVNLGVVMVVVIVCAIAGDSVGFEVGRKAGPWLTTHRPLKGNSAVRYTLGLLEQATGVRRCSSDDSSPSPGPSSPVSPA